MKASALAFLFIATVGLARISPQSEIALTKAVIAFREGKLADAQSQIEDLIKLYPEETRTIELKALIQKSRGDYSGSIDTYLRLLKKEREKWNTKKVADYAFELGSLCYSQKDLIEAHRYFKIAAKLAFNPAAAEFLLGKIDLENKKFQESRKHFETASSMEDFREPANMFIAQSYEQENLPLDAAGSYVTIKEAISEESQKENAQVTRSLAMAEKVMNKVTNELNPWRSSQWIREIGFSTGYDSNVLFMPNSSDANNISTTGSAKEVLHWGLRYASDPVEKWQYRGSYQGSINYNFNQNTQAGQFLSQDFSISLTRGALKSTNFGFNLGGVGIFQFQTSAYKPFSLSGTAGPFIKIKMNELWALGVESSFLLLRNFLDPNLDNSVRRSGWEQMIRAYVASRHNNTYWTPSVFLTGTLLRPEGKEFSGTRINLDFTNGMYLSNNGFVTQNLGISFARYPDRTLNVRSDQGLGAALAGGYQVSENLMVLAQIDYGQNFSNDFNFRYNRWSTKITGNYRL